MTAAQRSQAFRERHPTYHAEWKRRERARIAEGVLAMQAARPERLPLMLPAPQPPACDLLEQLAALRARTAELELVLASGATVTSSA